MNERGQFAWVLGEVVAAGKAYKGPPDFKCKDRRPEAAATTASSGAVGGAYIAPFAMYATR
ncbi:MAG TPA: hypothetical protein VGX94_00970 [Terriglobia bacterium]|nr:hypothetical protein [Terriglobia bacterium]